MVALTATLVSLIATPILSFDLTSSSTPEAKLSLESSFDNPFYLQLRHKGQQNAQKIY